MQSNHIILGVHIQDRAKQAPDIQKIFTEYGCQIKTRLGLHDVDADSCSPSGIIILDLMSEESKIDDMMTKLNAQDGIEVQKMIFDHD